MPAPSASSVSAGSPVTGRLGSLDSVGTTASSPEPSVGAGAGLDRLRRASPAAATPAAAPAAGPRRTGRSTGRRRRSGAKAALGTTSAISSARTSRACGRARTADIGSRGDARAARAHRLPAGACGGGDTKDRAGSRLPGQRARCGPRLPGDLRPLAGRRRLHARLQRAGHRGPASRTATSTPRSFSACVRARAPSGHSCPSIPPAIESFDLSGYDLVVSSSSAWAHAVICDEQTVHVSLLPQPVPLRLERAPPHDRRALRSLLARRLCAASFGAGASGTGSRRSASTATSRTRAPRRRASRSYFGRESEIVYPPVDTDALHARAGRARLPGALRAGLAQADRHRRRGLQPAAAAARGRGRRPARRRLERLAGPTISFAGRVIDAEAAELLASCRALVVTARRGVRHRRRRGAGRGPAGDRARRRRPARERGRGRDRLLWDGGPDELAAAVAEFDAQAVDPEACVENARRFDSALFREPSARGGGGATGRAAERLEAWPRISRRPSTAGGLCSCVARSARHRLARGRKLLAPGDQRPLRGAARRE